MSPKQTLADNRSDSPQATVSRWTKAVNKQNWREEYECYAGTQQAKFAYQVMVSTRELHDSRDLSVKLNQILDKFRFPHNLLDEFPGQRMDLSSLSDPQEIQSRINDQSQRIQLKIERWKCEVQPLNIDWAGMIGELQPLFTESYKRHLNDEHPSSTGIAHHLGYHRFDRASILSVDANRAQGTVVAIVRDPDIVVEEYPVEQKQRGIKAIFASFDHIKLGLVFRGGPVRRSPVEIGLMREASGWKIDSVPYR